MTGQLVGYARFSTEDQDLAVQLDRLRDAGCIKVFAEKRSGTSAEDRAELTDCLNYLRDGDTLVICKIDRLARSIVDLQHIVDDLQSRGIGLQVTDQPIDTSTAAGICFLQMLGVFAQFETAIRKERQMAGIAKAKSEGKYKGRRSMITPELLRRLEQGLEDGLKEKALCELLSVSKPTLYRAKRVLNDHQ